MTWGLKKGGTGEISFLCNVSSQSRLSHGTARNKDGRSGLGEGTLIQTPGAPAARTAKAEWQPRGQEHGGGQQRRQWWQRQ